MEAAAIDLQDDTTPASLPQFLEEFEKFKHIVQDLQSESKKQSAEISLLKATISIQTQEISAMKAQDERMVENIGILFSANRQLREAAKKAPGKTELARVEKIERYLSSRPDHRARFETLKGHLEIGNDQLNKTIKLLMKNCPGKYGVIQARAPEDKRKRTLTMLRK